jgi:hypothetical protein
MYADLALENAAISDVLDQAVRAVAKREIAETPVRDHQLPVQRPVVS